jgi:type IX secretion system PorP/SprF family membrane protein
MKRFLFFLFFIPVTFVAQHRGDYIQYVFNGVLLNPAYAGSQGALNVTGLYRNQWVGIDGAPVSKSFTAHSPLRNKKINIGINVENEKFAVYDHTNISALYAYRFKLSKGQLALGMQAGADIQSTNWNKLVIRDAGDPSFAVAPARSTSFVAGAGIYYHTSKLYAGFSAPQLFNNKFNRRGTLIFNSGLLIGISDHFRMKPAVLLKYLFGSPLSANVSATLYYQELIGFGVGYNVGSSMMAFIDLRLNEQLHFGYGYDRSVTRLNYYTNGSHELMLRYLFSYKVKAVNARYF